MNTTGIKFEFAISISQLPSAKTPDIWGAFAGPHTHSLTLGGAVDAAFFSSFQKCHRDGQARSLSGSEMGLKTNDPHVGNTVTLSRETATTGRLRQSPGAT